MMIALFLSFAAVVWFPQFLPFVVVVWWVVVMVLLHVSDFDLGESSNMLSHCQQNQCGTGVLPVQTNKQKVTPNK